MSKKSCFIICPIGSEVSPERRRAENLLKYVINKSLNGLDYTIIRADQIAKPGIITTQIIENLINADLVIADLHGHNPNVFYELGIRHAIGKPVIQIYHPDQRIPFDVAGLRSIKLDITDLESVDRCINELNLQIKAVEDNPTEITSPFSVTIDLQKLRSSNTSTETILSRIMEGIENLRSEIIPQKRTTSRIRGTEFKSLISEFNYLTDRRINLARNYDEVITTLSYFKEKKRKTPEDRKSQQMLLVRKRELQGLIDSIESELSRIDKATLEQRSRY